jgi:DNA polymerase III epsilon subunit-like protein
MATGTNDAELWLGICQRLAPVFIEMYQKLPDQGPLIFVDTETTGWKDSDIIELGAISVAPFETDSINVTDPQALLALGVDVRMEHFWELIDPGDDVQISPFAVGIHGITREMLKRHGRPAAETLGHFREWVHHLSPKHLVAHNAAFDKGMLQGDFAKHGIAYDLPDFLCTVKMAKVLPVINRKLGTLAEYFGCANQQAHRSITDAEVCAFAYARMALMEPEPKKKRTRRRRSCSGVKG